MPRGATPNLIIIGAMKCGTTALHHYLGLHPDISMSRPKELNFFSHPEIWKRGTGWYRQHFDPGAPVRGEGSPAYSSYPLFDRVPERMHRVAPDARLIYLVRDPVERVLSQFHHLLAGRHDGGLTLEQAVDMKESTLVGRSLYARQLERFLPWYPLERILVVQQERLLAQRRAELARVFEFLGVDASFHTPAFERRKHRSAGKRRLSDRGARLADLPVLRMLRSLSPGARQRLEGALLRPFTEPVHRPELSPVLADRLRERFRPDVERLRTLTGGSFEGWSV